MDDNISHTCTVPIRQPRNKAGLSARKVGGIWFVRIGRIGFNFYISRKG